MRWMKKRCGMISKELESECAWLVLVLALLL